MDIEQRAARARALLGDDLLNEVIDTIRTRCVAAFVDSAEDETEARERAKRKLIALNEVEGELRDALASLEIQQRKVRKRGND